MQILEQQGFIDLSNGGKIIENKRQQGIVEYVDPLASIFHLVRPPILPSTTTQLIPAVPNPRRRPNPVAHDDQRGLEVHRALLRRLCP